MSTGSVPRQAARRLWRQNECKAKVPVMGRQATAKQTKTKKSSAGDHHVSHSRALTGTRCSTQWRDTGCNESAASTHEHSPPTRPQLSSTPRHPPHIPPPHDHNTKHTHTSVKSAARTASAAAGTPARRSPARKSSRMPHAPMRAPSAARKPATSAMPGSSRGRWRRSAAAPAAAATRPPPATGVTSRGRRGKGDGQSSPPR